MMARRSWGWQATQRQHYLRRRGERYHRWHPPTPKNRAQVGAATRRQVHVLLAGARIHLNNWQTFAYLASLCQYYQVLA
jgi:hypothetical protein